MLDGTNVSVAWTKANVWLRYIFRGGGYFTGEHVYIQVGYNYWFLAAVTQKT